MRSSCVLTSGDVGRPAKFVQVCRKIEWTAKPPLTPYGDVLAVRRLVHNLGRSESHQHCFETIIKAHKLLDFSTRVDQILDWLIAQSREYSWFNVRVDYDGRISSIDPGAL